VSAQVLHFILLVNVPVALATKDFPSAGLHLGHPMPASHLAQPMSVAQSAQVVTTPLESKTEAYLEPLHFLQESPGQKPQLA
jgi:hypothetical protein